MKCKIQRDEKATSIRNQQQVYSLAEISQMETGSLKGCFSSKVDQPFGLGISGEAIPLVHI